MNQEIFPYIGVDGDQRWADPTRVQRIVNKLCEYQLKRVLEMMDSPDPAISERYTEVFLNAIAQAFRLQRHDEQTGLGYKDGELEDLFSRFLDWKQKKNQSTVDGLTSRGFMDSALSSPPLTPETDLSTLKSSTDYG